MNMPLPLLTLISLLMAMGACTVDPGAPSSKNLTYTINETGLTFFF